jgi:hypothetical protein
MVDIVIRFDAFTINLAKAVREFEAVAEADIRDAHGEIASRPSLSGIPEYLYDAAMRAEDADMKAHYEEVAAQQRALGLP